LHSSSRGASIWISDEPFPKGKDIANIWDIVVKGSCQIVAQHAALPS
jgi:NAD-dependent histone deacetylase SIR2